MKTSLITSAMVSLLVGCGTVPASQTAEDKAVADKAATASTATALNSDYFSVEGYVTPIGISVDGKMYKDSEDFYTQEVRKLQADVLKSYPGYKLTFDAAVGLRNFKTGMYVFLVATNDVGVASEAYVNANGQFLFTIDGSVDRKAEYTLRASKRIGLKLTKKGEETVSWCYNMYAEKNVALDGKPNILRNFTTSVTDYQCNVDAEGITIPSDFQNETDEIYAKQRIAEMKRVQAIREANEAPAPAPEAPEAPAPEDK